MTRLGQDFWAITSYYNLTESTTRLRNHRCFKRRLSVPLLTVEWHPDSRFQLKDDDADIVLRIGGGDLMWQKERLLSLAVTALPDTVKYVAWLDCDILFGNRDWADEARELLKNNSVVQLFSDVAYAGASESLRLINSAEPELDMVDCKQLPARESFVAMLGRLKGDVADHDIGVRLRPDANNCSNVMQRPSPGFAWAAQPAFLRDVGLYQHGIMGGGDTLFCYGMSGFIEKLIAYHRTIGWEFYSDCDAYRRWAQGAAAASRGELAYVRGQILHLFHGSLADGLVQFALDLDRDIVAHDGQPWSWRRDRDRLNSYFLKYLRARKEDDEIIASRFELASG